jgi:hypothetical protein
MADRAHIPSSPACGQWEVLLADALDGLLKPEDEAIFAEHIASCQACTALFDEARRGREWLEFLSPEPEVPAGLLDKILAQTGPGQVAGFGLMSGNTKVLPMQPAWQRPGFTAQIRRFAEPRLLMTAAMAFFSIALTLNLTGVRLSGLRMADLRPTAVRSFMERRFTTASVPIIRYYDHLRFVYEVESRVRELRRTEESDDQGQGQGGSQSTPSQSSPGESRQTPGGKDGGSRMDPLQQSGKPAAQPATGPLQNNSGEYVEGSLTFEGNTRAFRLLQNSTTGNTVVERSTQWIA